MTRLLLLFGLVFLQVPPEAHVPVDRPPKPIEADDDSLPPPPTGARLPVLVEALEGLPSAPRDREAFLRGFRGAFQERELPTERVAKSGAVRADAAALNRLRLAEGVGEKGAWRVRVRLAWLASPDSAADSLTRSWPGRDARVLVAVAWPEEARSAPPAQARTEGLRFPPGRPLDAAWYQRAGWQVGLLTLEAVQHAAGDLDDDQRLRLDGARRVTPAALR